jgi:hypothetical protein
VRDHPGTASGSPRDDRVDRPAAGVAVDDVRGPSDRGSADVRDALREVAPSGAASRGGVDLHDARVPDLEVAASEEVDRSADRGGGRVVQRSGQYPVADFAAVAKDDDVVARGVRRRQPAHEHDAPAGSGRGRVLLGCREPADGASSKCGGPRRDGGGAPAGGGGGLCGTGPGGPAPAGGHRHDGDDGRHSEERQRGRSSAAAAVGVRARQHGSSAG